MSYKVTLVHNRVTRYVIWLFIYPYF